MARYKPSNWKDRGMTSTEDAALIREFRRSADAMEKLAEVTRLEPSPRIARYRQAAARIEALSKVEGELTQARNLIKHKVEAVAGLNEDKVALAQMVAAERDTVASLRAQLDAMGRRLAEAEQVIAPFAKRAGMLDGLWLDHQTNWSPAYGATEITIGDLRAAWAFQKDTTHDQG